MCSSDLFEIHEQCMEGTLLMEAPLQAYARWLEQEAPAFYAELFEKRRYRWTGSTSVGSYAVSATTSHYDWAMKHLRKSRKAWAAEDG